MMKQSYLVVTCGLSYVYKCHTKDEVKEKVKLLKDKGYKRPTVYRKYIEYGINRKNLSKTNSLLS